MDPLFLELQTALAGEYSLERELGRGGMGVVYLAREVRLAREVAIKVLPPELAAIPARRQQFVREAQTAARLSHPNIVPIHRVDETNGFVYFVMAYVNGETLADRVRMRGPLAPHQAARILREVAWALTYAHANGIIHRDVKAENILLERGTERALVTDFGIAGAANDDARDANGIVAGSAHYASPEQIAGQPLDASSDLYSLGVVGYLALTGRLPFDAPTTREVVALQLTARPAALATVSPSTPVKLALLIERCLAKRPEHRFADANEFAGALDHAVDAPREIPAPLRVWVNRTNRSGPIQIVVMTYVTIVGGIGVSLATHTPLGGVAVSLFAVGLIGFLPAATRMAQLRRAGYDIADLRLAIADYWTRRREELVYEVASTRSRVSVRAKWAGLGIGALATATLLTLALSGVVRPVVTVAAAISVTMTVTSTVMLAGEEIRRRRLTSLGSWQTKFYNSKWGERFVKLCGLGIPQNVHAASLPQRTEVALGRATDSLYNALPKNLRRQLKSLPATVQRLEDDARKLRAEMDKLDASIAHLDGDARHGIPSAVIDFEYEMQIRADRDRLRTDLHGLREKAAERLAATVATLETIRLDLLRLQLGDNRVNSVTASLGAAQNVVADLSEFVAATREVDEFLARPRMPEPRDERFPSPVA